MGYIANHKALSLPEDQAGETKLGTCLLAAAQHKVKRIDTRDGRAQVRAVLIKCIKNN